MPQLSSKGTTMVNKLMQIENDEIQTIPVVGKVLPKHSLLKE
jgi:hypothetical protein